METFNELMTGLGYITFGVLVLIVLLTFGTFVYAKLKKPDSKEVKVFDHTDAEYWQDYYGD